MASKQKKYAYTNGEQKFLDDLWPEYGKSKEFWRRSIHRVWDKAYLDYRGIHALNFRYGDDYVTGYGLRISSTRIFQTVESIKPQLNNRPPSFEVSPFNPADTPRTRGIRYLLQADWERSRAQGTLEDITDDMVILGTGVGIGEFVDRRSKVQAYVGTTPDGVKKFEEQTIQRYVGNQLTWVDPYNCYPLPTALPTDGGTTGRVWVRFVVRADDLRRAYEGTGVRQDRLDSIKPGGDTGDFSTTRQIIDVAYRFHELVFAGSFNDANRVASQNIGFQKDESELIEVAYCKEPDLRAVVANGGDGPVVLEYGPNPSPHKEIDVRFARDYKINGAFWGMGEPEILRHLHDAETRLINNVLDASHMNVAPPIAYNSMYLKNQDAFRLKPWAQIPLKGQLGLKVSDAIQPLLMPDIGRGRPYELLGWIDEAQQNTTGISKFLIGTAQLTSSSATEVARKSDAPMARIKEKARHIERFVEEILNLWAANLALYDRAMVMNILEENVSVYLATQTRNLIDTTTGALVPNDAGVAAAEAAATAAGVDVANIVYADDLMQGVTVTVRAHSTIPPSKETDRQDLMAAMGLIVKAQATGIPIDSSTPVGKLIIEILKTFSIYDIQGSALADIVDAMGRVQPFAQLAPAAVAPYTPGRPPEPTTPLQQPPLPESGQLSSVAQPENLNINALDRAMK